MQFDVFISHASDDKDTVARPLAAALQRKGLSVWFDEFALKIGDSLSKSIDGGVSQSRFGVVILSPKFFSKHWTQRELRGLVSQEVARDNRMILPIWHGVTHQDVAAFSTTLADVMALSTEQGVDCIADRIMETILGASPLSEHRRQVVDTELDTQENEVGIISVAGILQRLYVLAEPKDGRTGDFRVGAYASVLARRLGCPAAFVAELRRSALLRDIGKIAIPDALLLKPGRLTLDEFLSFQRHTTIGSDFLSQIEGMEMAAGLARHHHERWDGRGYPDGLMKDEIPLEARIVAVADVYNALTQSRPYKVAFDHYRSLSILTESAGSHFDPEIVAEIELDDTEFQAILKSDAQLTT